MALVRRIFQLQAAAARHALPALTIGARRPLTCQGAIHDMPTSARTGVHMRISQADLDTMVGKTHSHPQAQGVPFDILFNEDKAVLADMIHKLPMNRTIVTHPLWSNWVNHHENHCPFFYATDKHGKLAGFALLHKTQAMVENPGEVPQALDLVYVMPQYRTEGLASLLLQEAIKHYRITCFCPDSETAELLECSGFHRQSVSVDHQPDAILMSYP